MKKPELLKKGDKVALVSLSSGMIGEPNYIHKYYIAKERLEKEFGLEVVTMPNALKGKKFVYEHPELRAKDLMDAFKDKSIKAVLCTQGGEDTIRLLPYIDYDVIRNNPKIFMGYSDTTANHLMMHKAGLVSFYGPSVMGDFGEYVHMLDNTKKSVLNILFKDSTNYSIESSPYWSKEFVPWTEDNQNHAKEMIPEEHGYEVIQGSGVVEGEVLGGCLDAFPLYIGTSIWPTIDDWKDKILFLEISEQSPNPELISYYLRNLGAQGIFDVIKGIIVGKPYQEKYYEEYKKEFTRVLKEFGKTELPIIYNINVGHAFGTGIIPFGTKVSVDYDNKKIVLKESPTINRNIDDIEIIEVNSKHI